MKFSVERQIGFAKKGFIVCIGLLILNILLYIYSLFRAKDLFEENYSNKHMMITPSFYIYLFLMVILMILLLYFSTHFKKTTIFKKQWMIYFYMIGFAILPSFGLIAINIWINSRIGHGAEGMVSYIYSNNVFLISSNHIVGLFSFVGYLAFALLGTYTGYNELINQKKIKNEKLLLYLSAGLFSFSYLAQIGYYLSFRKKVSDIVNECIRKDLMKQYEILMGLLVLVICLCIFYRKKSFGIFSYSCFLVACIYSFIRFVKGCLAFQLMQTDPNRYYQNYLASLPSNLEENTLDFSLYQNYSSALNTISVIKLIGISLAIFGLFKMNIHHASNFSKEDC